jgi:signal transduction histidine kinase
MRAVCVVLAAVGGCALALAVALELAAGEPAGAAWVLAGPAPFYAVGLAGVFWGPGHRAAAWLLACGAMFLLGVCLSDAVLPAASTSPLAWIAALVQAWASTATVVAGMGLIGLFPIGLPQRRSERRLLGMAAATAVLVPVLLLISTPAVPPASFLGPGAGPVIASPLFLAGARPLAPLAAALQAAFPAWIIAGVVLLYLRYRRSPPEDRRRIRWLLAGAGGALVIFAALVALAWPPRIGPVQVVVVFLLWTLTLVFVLGSLVVALSHDALLGIDQPTRRSAVYRAMRLLVAAGYAAVAVTLGLLAGRYLPIAVAVLLTAAVALAFQPVQRRLERIADRWVFGDRLDGYGVLSRLGAMLEAAPGPADVLPGLAGAVRRGLGLRWARVRLDLAADAGFRPAVGFSGIETGDGADPALVVPLVHAGVTLGRIECGPRHDGPLLDEDRRLLASLAAQASTTVRNLHLTAELSARLDVIRRQAAELSASRARVALAQDAERQRIQRDLHDGFQQDLVVLTAKLALARERLRRGDERADEPLAELQHDMAGLLSHLRDFAHAIHPPVLADQGLLEAIEAQAARLPIEVMIEADPALRGVRYPQHIEAATWYVVAEALTNAVKHARARRVLVALTQPDGHLAVEISDDGCGFDPAAARGLGLAGLADRIAIVNGALRVDSGQGRGTTLRAEVPLAAAETTDG